MREDSQPAKPMTGTVVPLPSLVPAPPEIVARAYELWSTVAGRNAAATRRLLEAEAEAGDAVPTDRAVRKWATAHGWHERADLQLRETAGRTVFELGVKPTSAHLRCPAVSGDARHVCGLLPGAVGVHASARLSTHGGICRRH